MARYILRRLLQIPLLLLGATILTFTLTHLAPGSPLDHIREQFPAISKGDLARISKSLGLDGPLYRQYLTWLGRLLHGDLGDSLLSRRPVRSEILDRLPNTIELVGASMLLSLLISIPVGIMAAVKRNSIFDQVVTAVSTFGFAIPSVWVGLLLILTFSVQARAWGLPVLPSSGTQSVIDGGGFHDRLLHLIMPVTTMSILQIAGWVRYVRAQMLEVLGQDYVRTARSKGLTERVVIYRHAFRNALLPLVTVVGLNLPFLIGGDAIVETIFSWPGLGLLATQSAKDHDYTLIIGLTVFVALTTLLANLLTDVMYAVVDPRITYK